MPPTTLNSEEPDLRDGCAALLVFRVGSARTLMGEGAPYDGGGALVVRHCGGHTPWRSHPCLVDQFLRMKKPCKVWARALQWHSLSDEDLTKRSTGG